MKIIMDNNKNTKSEEPWVGFNKESELWEDGTLGCDERYVAVSNKVVDDFYKIKLEDRTLNDYHKLTNKQKETIPMSALPLNQHPFTWPAYSNTKFISPIAVKIEDYKK